MKDGHEISDLSPNKNNEEKSLLGFDDLENFTEVCTLSSVPH